MHSTMKSRCTRYSISLCRGEAIIAGKTTDRRRTGPVAILCQAREDGKVVVKVEAATLLTMMLPSTVCDLNSPLCCASDTFETRDGISLSKAGPTTHNQSLTCTCLAGTKRAAFEKQLIERHSNAVGNSSVPAQSLLNSTEEASTGCCAATASHTWPSPERPAGLTVFDWCQAFQAVLHSQWDTHSVA